MRRATRRAFLLVALLGLGWGTLAGCGGGCCDGPSGVGPPVDEEAPSFLLEDVNDTSATSGQFLSPRAFLGGISAWYFGQAT